MINIECKINLTVAICQTLSASAEEFPGQIHSRAMECAAQHTTRGQMHHRQRVLTADGEPQQEFAH